MANSTLTIMPSQIKVSVVDNTEVIVIRRSKWTGFIEEKITELDGLKTGKSLKLDFPEDMNTVSFVMSARKYLKNAKRDDVLVVANVKNNCVFFGKK